MKRNTVGGEVRAMGHWLEGGHCIIIMAAVIAALIVVIFVITGFWESGGSPFGYEYFIFMSEKY